MKIGINAHLLAFTENYRQAGLSRHIYELVTTLPRTDPTASFVAFVGNGDIPPDVTANMPRNLKLSRSRFPTGRAPVRIAWEQLVLPFAAARMKLDLLHCPVSVRPFISPCPVVITIHDLIFLRYPKSYHPAKQFYLRAMSRWSAKHARHIIAVSEATRQDAIEMLGVSPCRVTTIHNGVGEQFIPLPSEEIEHFRQQHDLSGRTILYLGTLEPRKNITLLLDAFKEIEARPEYADVKLIIGGSKGWYYDEIFATAERLGLTGTDRVRFLGRVPDEELPLWYNVADVFAYPSLYEGFGLPPLEAMSCGTPVVVSNTSALPEVVGDAGLLLNPEDAAGWATAFMDLLNNRAIAQELAARGLRQAQKFNWQRAAEETLQVYRKALSHRNRKVRGVARRA
ncbi:MAG TPA: glycosyltransferase family 1 protein [Chloroflexia bacterium]|nr:glycosyltransferase family 1 protein [Chloroflexia bacterium]